MINKKEQKIYDYLFLDAEAIFDEMKIFFINEMRKMKKKEREYESIWKFINNFKVKDSFSEEFKITLAVIFMIVFSIWIGRKETIPVAKSDSNDFPISVIQIEKKEVDTSKIESDKKEADIKAANEYGLKSSEKLCEESNEQKISSDLCGKDDEEIVGEIEKESLDRKAKAVVIKKKPAIAAKVPYAFDVVGGRRVCDKKNDHPSKSNKGKGKHMDMECCLDPDEYPNPHCYYDPGKYGKYLR